MHKLVLCAVFDNNIQCTAGYIRGIYALFNGGYVETQQIGEISRA